MNKMFIPPKGSEIARHKTALCKRLKDKNGCRFGSECKFAHSNSEIRKYGDPIHISVKQMYQHDYGEFDEKWENEPNFEEKKKPKKPKPVQVFEHFDLCDEETNDNQVIYSETKSKKQEYHMEISRLKDEIIQLNEDHKMKMKDKDNIHKGKEKSLRSEFIFNQSKLKEENKYLSELNAELIGQKEDTQNQLEDYKKELTIHQDLQATNQIKLKEIQSEYFNTQEERIQAPDVLFQDLLKMTLKKMEGLLQCPINMEKIKNPVVLPSGITVDKEVMDRLIDKKHPDPFDRTKKWYKILVNRFVYDFIETLQNAKNNRDILNKKGRSLQQDQSIQVSGELKLMKTDQPVNDSEFTQNELGIKTMIAEVRSLVQTQLNNKAYSKYLQITEKLWTQYETSSERLTNLEGLLKVRDKDAIILKAEILRLGRE